MPACVRCSWFDPLTSACTIKGKPTCDSRACVAGVARSRLPALHGDVLEIGPGVWKIPRKLLRDAGATWHGIDPRFTRPAPGSNAYHGTAGKLPFPDARFDAVFGLETMEHWHENGESVGQGLAEIFRVLKPGGFFLATVPIHLHGAKEFLLGDIGTIFNHFGPEWVRFEAEAWRREYAPQAAAYDWQNEHCSSRKALKQKFGRHGMPANWVLELNAWKGV